MNAIIENNRQLIDSDLTLLRNGRIYELVKGSPKCSTLADRIEESLLAIIESYDNELKDKRNKIAKSEFDLHFKLLKALYGEISTLSKKEPDHLVNSFKISQINRVIVPIKDLLKDDQSSEFLDTFESQSNELSSGKPPTYSDVSFVLAQYISACENVIYNNHHGESRFSS